MKNECTLCGGQMKPAKISETVDFDGLSVTVDGIEADKCVKCGGAVYPLEIARKISTTIAAALAENGVILPEALKFMRKTMRLKATELAEMLGVAPRTVTRWETGEKEIDIPALITIQSMVRDFVAGSTRTADSLRKFRSSHKRPARKTLKVSMAG